MDEPVKTNNKWYSNGIVLFRKKKLAFKWVKVKRQPIINERLSLEIRYSWFIFRKKAKKKRWNWANRNKRNLHLYGLK